MPSEKKDFADFEDKTTPSVPTISSADIKRKENMTSYFGSLWRKGVGLWSVCFAAIKGFASALKKP